MEGECARAETVATWKVHRVSHGVCRHVSIIDIWQLARSAPDRLLEATPATGQEYHDWGGPATVWSLLCVAETRATRPNGEWGYRLPYAGPRVPRGVVTRKRRCIYRPSVIYLIVNKLLSLSLSTRCVRS